LNVVVGETHAFLERLIGGHVRLELALAPLPVIVNADPGQIGQVITNLVVNARDAMPEGGTLKVMTGTVELTAADGNLLPGPYAVLTVSDTGIGMDADTQSHMFEPFFTTKDSARGTGLGLATVHGIVEQSGGHIAVRSEVGEGSAIEVFLPCGEL
jgi:signal transduction histidine kinase